MLLQNHKDFSEEDNLKILPNLDETKVNKSTQANDTKDHELFKAWYDNFIYSVKPTWKQDDFLPDEHIDMPSNVYFIALATNMCNTISPQIQIYVNQKAWFTFILQVLISGGLLYEKRKFD